MQRRKGKEPIFFQEDNCDLRNRSTGDRRSVSLAASSNPDGLEWSMERLTGSTELENDGTGAHAAAEEIQEKTALLPDYGFKNSDSTFGTSFSGIAGSAVVLIVCVGACYAFRFFKKKKS